MSKRLAILSSAALLALSVSAAEADFTLPTTSAGPGQYGVSIAAVTTLTVPLAAAAAQICVEGAAARYTDDGVTTPSASVGLPWAAGVCAPYGGPLGLFKIIGASATIDASYYK